MELQWVDATRGDLRKLPDGEIRRLYNDMCCDQSNETTCDGNGNIVFVTSTQKRLIGNYFRGRGLAK